MKTTLSGLLVFILVFAMAPSALGEDGSDEVKRLVDRLRPEVRYADYTPRFSVERRRISFRHLRGDVPWDFFIIKDGDRHVALIPIQGFHSGVIYIQDFRPDHAPRRLDLPSERWHIDTAVGSELRTDAYIPVPEGQRAETYHFEVKNDRVILTRKYEGTARINKWTHRSRHDETINVTNTFVLYCDPVHGYVVDGTYDVRVKPRPRDFEFASLATHGRYSLWPGESTVDRTVVTPVGAEGFDGYYQNLAAIANAGRNLTVRDGGFAAFLNERTGWSPALTVRGGNAQMIVCNAHADLDFAMRWPAEIPADEDGYFRHIVHHRLLALPPELTRHVWDRMNVRWTDQRRVQIRIGERETFDDQPLPLTTRVRGITFTSGSAPISTDHSRTPGGRSLVVDGTVWPNIPQINLKPDTRYRLEAVVKMLPLSDEEIAQRTAAARERHHRELERLRRQLAEAESKLSEGRQGDQQLRTQMRSLLQRLKDIEEFEGLAEPEGFIRADFYEWSPHSGDWVLRQQTNSARPDADRWQKLELEFTAPAWGPFVNIVFVSRNARMYIDEFAFVPLEAEGERASIPVEPGSSAGIGVSGER
ncbi:MAG: hypothetical protein JJU36_08460 [Phycisphaeraceae bacterium]|nr:hypothetical protein [Phycisphaeraceae bacterium]